MADPNDEGARDDATLPLTLYASETFASGRTVRSRHRWSMMRCMQSAVSTSTSISMSIASSAWRVAAALEAAARVEMRVGENTSTARTPPDKFAVAEAEAEAEVETDLRGLVRLFLAGDAPPSYASTSSTSIRAPAPSTSSAATTAAVCLTSASLFALLEEALDLDFVSESAMVVGSTASDVRARFVFVLRVVALFFTVLAPVVVVVEVEAGAVEVGVTVVEMEVEESVGVDASGEAARRNERRGRAVFLTLTGPASSSSVSASASEYGTPSFAFAFFTAPSATRFPTPFAPAPTFSFNPVPVLSTGERTVVVIVVAIYFCPGATFSFPLEPGLELARRRASGRPVMGSRFSLSPLSRVIVLTAVVMRLAPTCTKKVHV